MLWAVNRLKYLMWVPIEPIFIQISGGQKLFLIFPVFSYECRATHVLFRRYLHTVFSNTSPS